jgi:hypothetical protein
MKTKIMGVITVVLVLGFGEIAKATIVDISTATNKPVYELGEDVTVFVIAYNPNPDPVTLYFPTSLQASYIMDDVFDLRTIIAWTPESTELGIPAYDSYTWNLHHRFYAMEAYPLSIGNHIVEGYVVGYGKSVPVEFEVVPEPSICLFFVIGFVAVQARYYRRSLR